MNEKLNKALNAIADYLEDKGWKLDKNLMWKCDHHPDEEAILRALEIQTEIDWIESLQSLKILHPRIK